MKLSYNNQIVFHKDLFLDTLYENGTRSYLIRPGQLFNNRQNFLVLITSISSHTQTTLSPRFYLCVVRSGKLILWMRCGYEMTSSICDFYEWIYMRNKCSWHRRKCDNNVEKFVVIKEKWTRSLVSQKLIYC